MYCLDIIRLHNYLFDFLLADLGAYNLRNQYIQCQLSTHRFCMNDDRMEYYNLHHPNRLQLRFYIPRRSILHHRTHLLSILLGRQFHPTQLQQDMILAKHTRPLLVYNQVFTYIFQPCISTYSMDPLLCLQPRICILQICVRNNMCRHRTGHHWTFAGRHCHNSPGNHKILQLQRNDRRHKYTPYHYYRQVLLETLLDTNTSRPLLTFVDEYKLILFDLQNFQSHSDTPTQGSHIHLVLTGLLLSMLDHHHRYDSYVLHKNYIRSATSTRCPGKFGMWHDMGNYNLHHPIRYHFFYTPRSSS